MDKILVKVRAADATLSWVDVLSDSEKQRMAGKHEATRPSFVTARALLRLELGNLLDCAPEDVPLSQEGNGPVILEGAAKKGPFFSVSHTGTAENGIIGVTVSNKIPVGIDLELPDRDIDWQRVAEKRYPLGDYEDMMLMDPVDAHQMFYKLWTLREALVKFENGKLMQYLKDVRLDMQSVPPKVIGETPAGHSNVFLFNHYHNENDLMIGMCAARMGAIDLNIDLDDAYRYEPLI